VWDSKPRIPLNIAIFANEANNLILSIPNVKFRQQYFAFKTMKRSKAVLLNCNQ